MVKDMIDILHEELVFLNNELECANEEQFRSIIIRMIEIYFIVSRMEEKGLITESELNEIITL